MGYCMQVRAESFHIKGENMAGAIAAIKALDGKEAEMGASGGVYRGGACESKHYSWVRNGFSERHSTLEGLLKEWGWYPEINHDPNGSGAEWEAFGINFEREKIGDEQILFNAIAPFVEPGSYIEMVGEDGTIWRWYFDGKECHEQTGSANFKGIGAEPEPDYKEKFEALVTDLKGLVERYHNDALHFGNEIGQRKVARHITELVDKHGG